MTIDQHDYYHNESIFQAFDEDLKTAEQVLEQLQGEALDQNKEWLAENLEVSLEAVKQRRGVK